MTIRCAVVDDHPVFRDGLARMLDAIPDMAVVATGSTAEEALAIVAEYRPDVLLLDIRLPDRSGVDILGELTQTSPSTNVVILTGFADEDLIVQALTSGARGVLYKECDIERIAEEIRVVSTGGVRLDAHLAARVVGELRRLKEPIAPSITTRETQILTLLTRGLSNCEIATKLGIQENTVKSHLSRLFEKLGVTDRLQAALYGVRLGLK
ncbi:MAG TPA: response regulator transcription factor [Armatimonadota bacterium]|jgi:DNA-binding NarL/FixJ family response regulator